MSEYNFNPDECTVCNFGDIHLVSQKFIDRLEIEIGKFPTRSKWHIRVFECDNCGDTYTQGTEITSER